jgi:hypothetical protein
MPDIFDEAAPSDVFDAAEGDVFDQAAHVRQQAVSSIESSTLPKSAAPTAPSSARLNLGPSPRSIPEGLQTEQEERRAGAPFVITPQDKVQSVPRPNQSLARPQAPDSSLNYAVPGNEVTGGVTGFFPSRTPRNGPGGQLPATPPLEAAKSTLGAIPPQSETELLPGAATELSAAQHLATPGERTRGASEAVQGIGEAVTPLMGPEVSEIGAAGGAALKNALRMGAGLGTGMGAQKAGEEISKALGASKDTQELVSQLSFWAPTILGMVGGNYEALPKDAAGRADAVFRNLVYKAGGTVPENATLEQATAAYKQAINNLHPDVSPATAQEAQILNAAWTAVKGRYKAGPPVAPPTRAELAEHLDRTHFESGDAARASYVAEQQAQEAPVAAKPKAPEAEVIPPSKPSPAAPEVAKPIVLEANQVEEVKPQATPRKVNPADNQGRHVQDTQIAHDAAAEANISVPDNLIIELNGREPDGKISFRAQETDASRFPEIVSVEPGGDLGQKFKEVQKANRDRQMSAVNAMRKKNGLPPIGEDESDAGGTKPEGSRPPADEPVAKPGPKGSGVVAKPGVEETAATPSKEQPAESQRLLKAARLNSQTAAAPQSNTPHPPTSSPLSASQPKTERKSNSRRRKK